MINVEYFKLLTVLIIDDDEVARNKLREIFVRLTATAYMANDGKEGLEIIKNKDIDIVLTDISMPQMDGMTLIEEVRKFDKEIHFIFMSAHTNSDYLLKAIQNNALNYFPKPININEVLSRISEIGELKQQHLLVQSKKQESEEYLNILNQIAIISKTDLKGRITYVNDVFCEIAGYTQDELIGKPHNIVRHPEMPSNAFKDMWDTIQEKKIWKGKVKNLAKDGSSYFVNTTVYPILDDETSAIKEYMSVRFLITEEEQKTREFKKNILKTIADNKRQNFVARSKIDELEAKLKQIKILQDNYDNEKKRSAKLHSQILHYEDQIRQMNENHEKNIKTLKERVDKYYNESVQERKKNENNRQTIASLNSIIELNESEILKLNEQVVKQNKLIVDLKDVISHREEELGMKRQRDTL